MTKNKKAAVDVASIGDSRIDQASQQDLPGNKIITYVSVNQATERFFLAGSGSAPNIRLQEPRKGGASNA